MNFSTGVLVKYAVLVALGLCPMLFHLAIAMGGARIASAPGVVSLVDTGLVATSALAHTLIYLALLATFGSTLLPRRDPFVTALSRKMHGPMSDEMARYTRGVTWAWSLFFASQLMTSLLLYLFAPIYVWSLFVNVMTLPLVTLMFVAEHAYRVVHLRDAPRHSLADIGRMIGYIRNGVTKQPSSD